MVAELQRQPGHKQYEPVWTLLHKLRAVMDKPDERLQSEKSNQIGGWLFYY